MSQGKERNWSLWWRPPSYFVDPQQTQAKLDFEFDATFQKRWDKVTRSCRIRTCVTHLFRYDEATTHHFYILCIWITYCITYFGYKHTCKGLCFVVFSRFFNTFTFRVACDWRWSKPEKSFFLASCHKTRGKVKRSKMTGAPPCRDRDDDGNGQAGIFQFPLSNWLSVE